jgi:integrase/recombinase XerD
MRTNSPDFDTLTRYHGQNCQSEGKSPKTIIWYAANLKRFRLFCEKYFPEKPIEDIGTHEARQFVHHLQNNVKRWESCPDVHDDKGLSPFSIQGYVRSIKAFWSCLYYEGYIDNNPMTRLKIPKAPRKVIATFSDEQISSLLSACDRNTPRGYRNYLILLILFDTGIRLSELTGISIGDVDFVTSSFKVTGKGRKERNVPFGSQVRRCLWRYIRNFRPEPESPQLDQLLLSTRGGLIFNGYVRYMMRHIGISADVTGIRCSPHTCRHTFAKNYLLNGGDVFSLQNILGHSSLEVLKIYVNLVSSEVSAQHRQFSPVDKMKFSRKASNRLASRNEKQQWISNSFANNQNTTMPPKNRY